MKIYLVRHGQSRWQVERNDADWDSPLTDMGQTQSRFLANWLQAGNFLDRETRMEIGVVCTSPMRRAEQTAAVLANALELSPTTVPNLREADFYVSEQLPSRKTPYQALPLFRPTTSYERFKEQTQNGLHTLIEKGHAAGKPVLAVAHGGLISTMLRLAIGSDAVSFWIYNATLSMIEWKRGRWHLVYLNLWDHLPPAFRTY